LFLEKIGAEFNQEIAIGAVMPPMENENNRK